MCGEKKGNRLKMPLIQGSPPHVRGKDSFILNFPLFSRITPACAGKRWGRMGNGEKRQDHPRMCGEKSSLFDSCPKTAGSPPHVRGKAWDWSQFGVSNRITPACAGKSRLYEYINNRKQDHPRMCGEKRGIGHNLAYQIGSPPHVRGKENPVPHTYPKNRITPACAGKRLRNVKRDI